MAISIESVIPATMRIYINRGTKNIENGEFDYYLSVFFNQWTKTNGEKWAGFRSIYSYANHRDLSNPDPKFEVKQWKKILEKNPDEKTFKELLFRVRLFKVKGMIK